MASKINEQITVSAQIAVGEISAIAAQGFNVLICNRPDGEEPGQPDVAAISAEAENLGMKFIHIPIASLQFAENAAQEFQAVLDEGGRVFAYCRTGTRSAGLWALASAGRLSADEILTATGNAGYNFDQLEPYLRSKEIGS